MTLLQAAQFPRKGGKLRIARIYVRNKHCANKGRTLDKAKSPLVISTTSLSWPTESMRSLTAWVCSAREVSRIDLTRYGHRAVQSKNHTPGNNLVRQSAPGSGPQPTLYTGS